MTGPRLVPPELDGERLDRVVAALWSFPRAAARRLCAAGRVRLGARRADASDRAAVGDAVSLVGDAGWFADAPPVAPLYVDADVVVVDKPAGRACHPLVPGEGGTVVDAVVAAWPEVAGAGPDAREGGLLHRLDNDTTGCLAFARHRAAFASLAPTLREDAGPGPGAVKTYLALVVGRAAAIVIDGPLEPVPGDPTRVRVADTGRPARTVLTVRAATAEHAIVELALHGGRRHQLRAHLASVGHPIVGDPLYGPAPVDAGLPLCLHAWRLGLPGRSVVEAPVPAAFARLAEVCGLGEAIGSGGRVA